VSTVEDAEYQVQVRRPGQEVWQAATTWQRPGASNARHQAARFAEGYPAGGAVRLMRRRDGERTEEEVWQSAPLRKCQVIGCSWDTRGTNGGAQMPRCWPGTGGAGELELCLLQQKLDGPEDPAEDAQAAVDRVRKYCRELRARSMAELPAEHPEEGSEEAAVADATAARYFVAQRVLQLLRGPA